MKFFKDRTQAGIDLEHRGIDCLTQRIPCGTASFGRRGRLHGIACRNDRWIILHLVMSSLELLAFGVRKVRKPRRAMTPTLVTRCSGTTLAFGPDHGSMLSSLPLWRGNFGNHGSHGGIDRNHCVVEILAGFLHHLMGGPHRLLKGGILLDRLVVGSLELLTLRIREFGHGAT